MNLKPMDSQSTVSRPLGKLRSEAEITRAMEEINQRRQRPPSAPVTIASNPNTPSPSAPAPLFTDSIRYSAVDDIKMGKLASHKWDDEDLKSIPVYRIAPQTSAKCIHLGRKLVEALISGVVSSTTADICLVLALSLPKPAQSSFSHLLSPISITHGIDAAFQMPESSDMAAGLSHAQKKSLQNAKDKLVSAATSDEAAKYKRIIETLEAQERGATTSSGGPVNIRDATAYCFLAAYLLKLNGKEESTFMEGLTSMKLRYPSWYEGNSIILQEFKPTLDVMRSLRMIFNRRPEILATWVLTVAENENKPTPLSSTQQGLLNYLVCQQYAYTGMHAYNLLVSIHENTGIKLGTLLREMDCPATRLGIQAAFNIIRDFEITTSTPNRSTYFRYARVWNPKYFTELQSSNCTTLVYVAAKVSKITLSQRFGGDPMNIFAIKNMDAIMKARLDGVAVKIANMILESMLVDKDSGVSWRSN